MDLKLRTIQQRNKVSSNKVIQLCNRKHPIVKNKTYFEIPLQEVLQKSRLLSLSYSLDWFKTERDGKCDSVKQALDLQKILLHVLVKVSNHRK